VSQRQLHDPARACGEEAGGILQHLTQVNPRKADLIWASMLANVTPNIQPRSEWYWGRRRQDIDHSYFKRAPQVRLGGRVGEGNDDDPMSVEKSDLLIRAMKLAKAGGAKEEMD
jgi:hypothetical protein